MQNKTLKHDEQILTAVDPSVQRLHHEAQTDDEHQDRPASLDNAAQGMEILAF